MSRTVFRKIGMLSVVCIAITILYFSLPCYGAEYQLSVDVSPNIINLASQRVGEIRILTDMRYSTFVANGDSIFIYFNESDSVENIRATRDSLGNLILKFDLEDLLALEAFLSPDGSNDVQVVVIMNNGDEYSGFSEVYLTAKRAH